MQFFLTDLALGFGALFGYLTYEILARRHAPSASAAQKRPADDLQTVDPRRLVNFR
jgi:hypothetical protein